MQQIKRKVIVTQRVAEVLSCPDDIQVIIIDPYTMTSDNVPVVCYQPEYDEKLWALVNFLSFMVYRNKEHAHQDFPDLNIVERNTREIEAPVFLD